jgi:outer membrane protein OmpA-like peptidoglycan-associated protein
VSLASTGNAPAAIANPSCAALSLVNGNFEAELPDPKPNYNFYWGNFLDASQSIDAAPWLKAVPGIGWRTTQSDHSIEVWAGDPALTEASGPVAFDGNAFAELNANEVGALYQDVATVPGTAIVWSLAHRARVGTDVMAVKIGHPDDLTSLGAPTAALQQGPNLSDGTSAWGVHTGVYVVPAGQVETRFWFESISSGNNDNSYGNFLDGVSFMPYNCSSETPTYSAPTIAPTADGFTFQLTNYDASGMTASSTVGAVSISPTGLVTLTDVPAGTAASVVITNHHEGFIDASVAVDANSLGSALVPKFDTPAEIVNGFTAQVTNYDPDFNWSVSTTDSSSATISSSGLVTVTNATINTVVPVTTTKASHLKGSAFVKKTSVKLPDVVFVPVVVPPSNSYSEPAPLQLAPKPVAAVRKPVTISIGGFKDGSAVLTNEIKTKIRKFLEKYSDYKVITITGFTEGPTVLKRDRALSRMRAINALDYVKKRSIVKFGNSSIRASQEKLLGPKIRRIQITLQDN